MPTPPRPAGRGTAMAQTTNAVRWPLATPLARALARDLGVDLAAVTGSGRGGRIRRADVEALAAAAASPEPAAAAVEAPHFHLTVVPLRRDLSASPLVTVSGRG